MCHVTDPESSEAEICSQDHNLSAIGIDIDGTITGDPAFFSSFVLDCKKHHICVHIVSARPRESIAETEAELLELGISYDKLYLLPPIEEAIMLCPHSDLEWFLCHFWLKVDYAISQGLSCFVDDNERVLELFRSYAPEVLAISAFDQKQIRQVIPQ